MLEILVSVAITNAPANLSVVKSVPLSPIARAKQELIIAQKYGGTDPHGPDPHGDDPRDEVHDSKMPANAERSNGKAPKDVYGGKVPNDQAPY
jgi:hypothetical protein